MVISPLSFCEFFEIHGSKFKPYPIRDLGEAAVERTMANARKIEQIFCTKRGLTDTRNCANLSYSSLAQSVERMTVNHDVAGSSPAGGAIYVVRKDYYTQKSLIFKDFSCF